MHQTLKWKIKRNGNPRKKSACDVIPFVTADVAFLIPPTADKTAINQK